MLNQRKINDSRKLEHSDSKKIKNRTLDDSGKLKLSNFLPVYPNIIEEKDSKEENWDIFNPYNNFLPNAPDHVKKNPMYQILYQKKEFYKNRLEFVETKPKKRGILLMNQQSLMQFLSPHTPYSIALVVWGLGVGKSCVAASVAEMCKKIRPDYGKALILTKGDAAQLNLKKEIVFTCTPGNYIPDGYADLPTDTKTRRVNKNLSENYEFANFIEFSADIKNLTPEFLKKRYSNRVIIIDEGHNIKQRPETVNRSEGKKSKKNHETVSTYEQIKKLLHSVQGCKIIIMTGTPMRDKASEIAGLINLVSPKEEALPMNAEFDKMFFDTKGNLKNVDVLKKAFFGKISYIRSMKSDRKENYVGEIVNGMKNTRLKICEMSNFQARNYIAAFKKDSNSIKNNSKSVKEKKEKKSSRKNHGASHEDYQSILAGLGDDPEEDSTERKYLDSDNDDEITSDLIDNLDKKDDLFDLVTDEMIEKENIDIELDLANEDYGGQNSSLFINSQNTALFVYPKDSGYLTDTDIEGSPDGEPEGYKKYLESRSGKIELKKLITQGSSDPDVIISNIKKCGIKIGLAIEEIVKFPNNLNFVYSNIVTGSGAKLIAELLTYFGYSEAKFVKDSHERIPAKKRFMIVTGSMTADNERTRDIFNSEENINGKLIQVVIGSRVIGESVSFKNVVRAHILTPWWNDAETRQAIGRILRAFAHSSKLTEDINIIRYAINNATLKDGGKKTQRKILAISIDFKMYSTSEDKAIKIAKIFRLMKESAFDCALSMKRNMLDSDISGSSECDYTTCKYKCDYIDMKKLELREDQIISDSYNMYYALDEIDHVLTTIIIIFRKIFSIDYYLLKNHPQIQQYSEIVVIRALKILIEEYYPIINRFGITCYLKEDRNLYYLVDDNRLSNSFNLLFYTRNPYFSDFQRFDKYLASVKMEYAPEIIKYMFNGIDLKNKDKSFEFSEQLSLLTPRINEIILENVINIKNTIKEEKYPKSLSKNQMFGLNSIEEKLISKNTLIINGKLVSTLLGTPRCLSDNLWINCEEDDLLLKIKEEKEEKKTQLTVNIDKLVKKARDSVGMYAIINKESKTHIFRLRDVSKDQMIKQTKGQHKNTKTKGQHCMIEKYEKKGTLDRPILNARIMRMSDIFIVPHSQNVEYINDIIGKGVAEEIMKKKKIKEMDFKTARTIISWGKILDYKSDKEEFIKSLDKNPPRKDILKIIKSDKNLSKIEDDYKDFRDKKASVEQLMSILFWEKATNPSLCKGIMEALESNGLVQYIDE